MSPLSSAESPADSLKKFRRKHKNSRLGCVQCKERRMKCNEELPACRNCVIRQVKIPCSYLSFTEEEKEEFRRKKAQNDVLNGSSAPMTPRSFSPFSDSAVTPNNKPFIVKLVKHTKRSYLESQNFHFAGELPYATRERLYFISHINDQYFVLDHAFSSFLSLPCLWISIKLKHKLNLLEKNDEDTTELEQQIEQLQRLSVMHKSNSIPYLRDLVLSTINELNDRSKAFKIFETITLPTFVLQSVDLLSLESLKFYYVSGSTSMLREFFGSSDKPSPLTHFIARTMIINYNTLFIPNYSMEFLYGFLQTLEDFKQFVLSTNDPMLEELHEDLANFIREDVLNSDWESHHNPSFVIPYEPIKIYALQHKFTKRISSYTFTIDSQSSNIHKIFFTFYYALARSLDNIFPESRYLSVFRFIGPLNYYPILPSDIVVSELDDDLKPFAIYTSRVLGFFSRRYDFFFKYMVLNNPLPDELDRNRFAARKAKIDEVFVRDFRNTALQPHHYPRPTSNEKRLSVAVSSPSSDIDTFDTSFALNLSMDSTFATLKLNDAPMFDSPVDLSIYERQDNGLLSCDFDPIDGHWPEEVVSNEYSNEVISKFLEDRVILMRRFSK